MENELGKRIIMRLNELCAERKINLIDLGRSCNVSPATIEKLIRGKTYRFSVSTMKKLCAGLKISLMEFYDSDLFR